MKAKKSELRLFYNPTRLFIGSDLSFCRLRLISAMSCLNLRTFYLVLIKSQIKLELCFNLIKMLTFCLFNIDLTLSLSYMNITLISLAKELRSYRKILWAEVRMRPSSSKKPEEQLTLPIFFLFFLQ